MIDPINLLAALAAAAAFWFMVRLLRSAHKSGELTKLLIHPLESEGDLFETPQAGGDAQSVDTENNLDLGNRQFVEYFNLVTHQARAGFKLAAVFAGLGLVLLIVTAVVPATYTGGLALLQLLTGGMLLGLAGVFFNRLKSTHRAICECLEKLMARGRQLKARELCESVNDEESRDALRIQLALHYAGVSRALHTAKAITRMPLSDN